MTIEDAFEALRQKHGSHSAAARALNINVSHYRDLRNGRANMPARTKEFLLMKAGGDIPEQDHPSLSKEHEA